MTARAPAVRPLIPGERSSKRSTAKPRNYFDIHHYGIYGTVGEHPKFNASGEKRKQEVEHQPNSEQAEPAKKRARNSRSKQTSTTSNPSTPKSKTKAPNGASKSAPKSKYAAKARASRPGVNTDQSIEAMTGKCASANAVENLTLDPDGNGVGNSTAKRGSKAITKPATRRTSAAPTKRVTRVHVEESVPVPQQISAPDEDASFEDLRPMGESEPSPDAQSSLSNIAVAGAVEQLPTPESSNKALLIDFADPGSSENPQQEIITVDEAAAGTKVSRYTTPDQPTTPADPSSSSVCTLTEFTSTAGDEEPPILGQQVPVTAIGESQFLTHAHPLQAPQPAVEPAAGSADLLVGDQAVEQMVPQTPESTRPRSRRSTNPIKRFVFPVDTSTAIRDESSDEEIKYERVVGNHDSDDSMEVEETGIVDTNDDSHDGDFATTTKLTPKSTSKGKLIDLVMLVDSPVATTNLRKRKLAVNGGPAEPPKVKQPMDSIVKLRVSSDKLTSSSPAKLVPIKPKPIGMKPIEKKPIQKKPAAIKKTPTTKRASALIDLSRLLTPPDAQSLAAVGFGALADLDETGLDPKLVQISKKLMARLPLPDKPCGHKTSQSGHCREYTDSDVIIARAGGSMESDPNGGMIQKKDHGWNESQVQAVMNDIEHQNPLVIIAGNRNENAICKLPYRYSVLGWYKPVAVWAEKSMGKGKKTWMTIKYRFERLNCSTAPWFAPNEQNLLTADERNSVGPLRKHNCGHCGHNCPHVYLNGWICLNADCEQFWKMPSGQDAPCGKIYYHPAFLLSRKKWENEEEPYSVRPTVPDVGNVVDDNVAYINTRGICCRQCGRCSHRRLFKGWQCDNPLCGYSNFPKHMPVKAPMLHNPWETAGDGPSLSRNTKSQGVQISISNVHGYKIFTYTFNGVNGRFVPAISNAKLNRQENGPDDMFAAMQRQDDPDMDLHLERRRFAVECGSGGAEAKGASIAASRPTGRRSLAPRRVTVASTTGSFRQIQEDDKIQADDVEILQRDSFQLQLEEEAEKRRQEVGEDGNFMTAFSMNYGMPYKFIDPAGHEEFNELLIFAYLEDQKIEYHDDGESGLGPRIATMSLGGKAKMHMRMKMRHYVGCSKSGLFNAEKPIPGSIDGDEMYQKRLVAWKELEELKQIDTRAYTVRRKELPKELGIFENRTKQARDLVTVTLNHGDIVLMEGYEIQKYLEHKVVPESCLRFALICRTVLPDHLKAEERPSYDVAPHDPSVSALYRMEERERERRAKEVVSDS